MMRIEWGRKESELHIQSSFIRDMDLKKTLMPGKILPLTLIETTQSISRSIHLSLASSFQRLFRD